MKIVKVKLRPSWTEDYLQSLVNKAIDMQIFIRDEKRGTLGLDPRFHELMGEHMEWALSVGHNNGKLKSEDVAGVVGKYFIGDIRNEGPDEIHKRIPEFQKLIEDKTFQDMCRMLRDFIVNATSNGE